MPKKKKLKKRLKKTLALRTKALRGAPENK